MSTSVRAFDAFDVFDDLGSTLAFLRGAARGPKVEEAESGPGRLVS